MQSVTALKCQALRMVYYLMTFVANFCFVWEFPLLLVWCYPTFDTCILYYYWRLFMRKKEISWLTPIHKIECFWVLFVGKRLKRVEDTCLLSMDSKWTVKWSLCKPWLIIWSTVSYKFWILAKMWFSQGFKVESKQKVYGQQCKCHANQNQLCCEELCKYVKSWPEKKCARLLLLYTIVFSTMYQWSFDIRRRSSFHSDKKGCKTMILILNVNEVHFGILVSFQIIVVIQPMNNRCRLGTRLHGMIWGVLNEPGHTHACHPAPFTLIDVVVVIIVDHHCLVSPVFINPFWIRGSRLGWC